MSEYESTLLPIKTCDYCGTRGTMCTFANGETLCDKCMKELPITCTEARKEVYRLRAENQQQAERLKLFEVQHNEDVRWIDRVNEQLVAAEKDAERYRLMRRGQHWSIINGIGDALRAEELDQAIDATIAAHKKGESQ